MNVKGTRLKNLAQGIFDDPLGPEAQQFGDDPADLLLRQDALDGDPVRFVEVRNSGIFQARQHCGNRFDGLGGGIELQSSYNFV